MKAPLGHTLKPFMGVVWGVWSMEGVVWGGQPLMTVTNLPMTNLPIEAGGVT